MLSSGIVHLLYIVFTTTVPLAWRPTVQRTLAGRGKNNTGQDSAFTHPPQALQYNPFGLCEALDLLFSYFAACRNLRNNFLHGYSAPPFEQLRSLDDYSSFT